MRLFYESKVYKPYLADKIAHLVRMKMGQGYVEFTKDLNALIIGHCTYNRYQVYMTEGEILKTVERCIEKYRFLLESGLDSQKVKSLFVKALMDAITSGSGTYFLLLCSGNHKFKPLNRLKWTGQCYYEERFGSVMAPVKRLIDERYPNLPGTRQTFKGLLKKHKEGRTTTHFPFGQQILHAFSYPAYHQFRKNKFNPEKFANEFLPKNKWCLERMSKCDPIFLNKYKEGICREISYDLGLDTDRELCQGFFYFKNPIAIPRNDNFLKGIQTVVISCFSEQELELFNETDAEGKPGNLKEQLWDRYCTKPSSFAPKEQIEEKIRLIIEDYKPLLTNETSEVIREIILDEIEDVAFVSKATHLGNKAMEKNLREGRVQGVNANVENAIDSLIKRVPQELRDGLSVEIGEHKYTLKERLMARGQGALLGVNLDQIQKHFIRIYNYTPDMTSGLKESDSEVELQAFLAKTDMFFLYPNEGQFLKKFVGALDTGRTIKKVDICDSLWEHRKYHINTAIVVIALATFILMLVLLICFVSVH